jgi:hypothetical protein
MQTILGQRTAVVSIILPPNIPGFSAVTVYLYILDTDDKYAGYCTKHAH